MEREGERQKERERGNQRKAERDHFLSTYLEAAPEVQSCLIRRRVLFEDHQYLVMKPFHPETQSRATPF